MGQSAGIFILSWFHSVTKLIHSRNPNWPRVCGAWIFAVIRASAAPLCDDKSAEE